MLDLAQRVDPRKASRIKSFQQTGLSIDVFNENDPGEYGSPEELISWPPQTRCPPIAAVDARFDLSQDEMLKAMRTSAQLYDELVKVARAIHDLHNFRRAATRLMASRNARMRDERIKTMQIVFDDVHSSVELCLAPAFLTTAVRTTRMSSDKVAARLAIIRQTYLPELILAFNAVLVCLADVGQRDCLSTSLVMADLVADDENLTNCFVRAGRMRELMQSMAVSARALLRFNERKDSGRKKRIGWEGTDGWKIWEVDAKS